LLKTHRGLYMYILSLREQELNPQESMVVVAQLPVPHEEKQG